MVTEHDGHEYEESVWWTQPEAQARMKDFDGRARCRAWILRRNRESADDPGGSSSALALLREALDQLELQGHMEGCSKIPWCDCGHTITVSKLRDALEQRGNANVSMA